MQGTKLSLPFAWQGHPPRRLRINHCGVAVRMRKLKCLWPCGGIADGSKAANERGSR
jgi:hypothetical protein